MSSSARKIQPSEWERHKDLIVELYRAKPLKDVRAEMQNQHGFDASSWQYEMQLKRWNVRKNATRKEWQQYFEANKNQSIPTSLGDAPGRIFSSVVLSKSTASKKRASRWVSGSLAKPSPPQASGSGPQSDETHPIAASIPDSSPAFETTVAADFQNDISNVVNAFDELESAQVHTGPFFSNMSATYGLELHAGFSPAFFDTVGGPAQYLDLNPTCLHAWSSPVVPGVQSPFPRHDSPDRAVFASVGLPAENNTTFFRILKETSSRRELPSAQFEHNLRSKGIILDRVSGSAILGGFAAKFVAGILSSKSQSMVQRTSHLQNFLLKLGSQIPGENSALITDDQAFETKFARVLLFSMLNGFAGLDNIPMGNILRFLNRFVVNKLLLDILEKSPKHVSRTLADNIFRAAIEATDTKVVNLLLSRKLVDINEPIIFHYGFKYTPIERAAVLRSPKLVKLLIDAGANIHKSYAEFREEFMTGALGTLIVGVSGHAEDDGWSGTPTKLCETFNMLVSAGAEVHPRMIRDSNHRTVEIDFLIIQNLQAENHRDFFQRNDTYLYGNHTPLGKVARDFDDCLAAKSIRKVINLCQQNDCNTYLVNFVDPLSNAAIVAAWHGKFEFVQFLLDKADLNAGLPRIFSAAIKSHSHALIDLILRLDPELDPPATVCIDGRFNEPTTPIAEAVRSGNEDLIRKFEEGGCLDHLNEGGRFEAVLSAAAEAGNTAYTRKLLACGETSKRACRVTSESLWLAIREGRQAIIQILLEAGASLDGASFRIVNDMSRKTTQTAHALIASGLPSDDIRGYLALEVYSIFVNINDEYPGLRIDFENLNGFIQHCIRTDTPESFKELLQLLSPGDRLLNECLKTVVELGHIDLIQYLLDMGANAFHSPVLHAAIPDRPDMLQLLFQTKRRQQTNPECIGASILESLMDEGVGNAEALDALIRTNVINFKILEPLQKGRVRLQDWVRFTPLGLAIQGVPGKFVTNMVAMRKFLDAGADPNGISKTDEFWTIGSPLMTALMVATETGREDAVNLLLDYGADMNARPRIRTTRTALQFAAELGSADMVRLLLSRGAEVNSSASPRGGATALQFAAMSGNCNMVADLLDHGAQLDALPSRIDGMWPLEGAAANGRLDMIRFLWELNIRAVAGGTFPNGFSERHCLRAMNFARQKGHVGCRDLISALSGIALERLETDEYGAPWIAY